MALGLVIFDCDGVLIDSEALCDRVVSAELRRAGWDISEAECHRLFLGLTFPDIETRAEAHLGRALPPDWVAQVVQRVTAWDRLDLGGHYGGHALPTGATASRAVTHDPNAPPLWSRDVGEGQPEEQPVASQLRMNPSRRAAIPPSTTRSCTAPGYRSARHRSRK